MRHGIRAPLQEYLLNEEDIDKLWPNGLGQILPVSIEYYSINNI